jgi:ketosteroid isomerase-like protein
VTGFDILENMRDRLTAELIKREVERFWHTFQAKDAEALHQFYAPEATVFGSSSARPEPGRLASARRQREYFHSKTVVRVNLGNMDVLLLGDHSGVCGYSLDFDASRVAVGVEVEAEEHIRQGRVSQVFSYDSDDRLRIVHEHISVPYKIS